jgi:hypothetical protein
MASKPTAKNRSAAVVEAPANASALTLLDIGDAERALAEFLDVELGASIEAHERRCLADMRAGFEAHLRLGLRLLAIKSACEHGEFQQRLQALGIGAETAQRRMRLVKAISAEGDARRREALISMGPTKALGLLAASPQVRDQVLQDAALLRDALEGSTRQFEERVAELESHVTDLTVQRDTAEAEAEGLKKRLKRGLPDREDSVPVVVADLRAEVLALGKKAELALDSFIPLQAELSNMAGIAVAADWADATTRLAYSQLAALRVQIDGLLEGIAAELPDAAQPTPLTPLTKQEIQEAARQFAELTQVHTYEAELRAWEREQGRPQGKGRPKNKPEAPAAAEPAAPAKAGRGSKGAAS